MSDAHLNPEFEPTEWLAVPPTGVSGCPLEDWLGALNRHGFEAVAKRDPEGLWIHIAGLSIAGFVSLDKGIVEAINFEIAGDVPMDKRKALRMAVEKLGWEIWDQDSDDDDDDDDD